MIKPSYLAKWLLPLCAVGLMGCAGTSKQTINGVTYKAETTEVTANRSLVTYLNAKQNNRNLFIEQQELPKNQRENFILSWLLREQEYRKQECTIRAKHYAGTEYFVCRPDQPRLHVIYQLETQQNKGIAKIFVVRNGVLSLADEQAVVESMSKIKLH